MGIPSYFSYIVKNHRNIIRKLDKNTKIDYIFLDSNSIIYDCLHKLSSSYEATKKNEFEELLINYTISKIEEYISIISPSKGAYISFDGVAPVAKLEQQRTRRHKSLLEYKLNQELNPKYIEMWDKISITPGTEFMNKLNTTLSSYFKKKGSFYMFSGSNEVGEGEHKIFQYVRENKSIMQNKSIVVYGLDADLIMLGINHLHISNKIYLFRETPEFIKTIDSSLIPNENYMIHLNELSNGIVSHMKNFNNANVSENVIKDYMFLCFFLGNDFLPHFPAVNIRTVGIQILMNAYKQVLGSSKKTIINNNKIQWPTLSKIMEILADNEHDNLLREHKVREKISKRQYPSKTYDEQLLKYNRIPITNREVEIYINPEKYGWEKRYYDKLLHCDNNRFNIKKICINYLEGIEWTFNYYSGNTIDWNWKYNYHYPPLLKDLNKYIPHWNYDILNIESPENDINEYIQLAYVLPKEKLNYLPPKYHYKLLENLSEYYLEDYDLEWSYCKYMWEAHPNLPNLNVTTIKDLFENIN